VIFGVNLTRLEINKIAKKAGIILTFLTGLFFVVVELGKVTLSVLIHPLYNPKYWLLILQLKR